MTNTDKTITLTATQLLERARAEYERALTLVRHSDALTSGAVLALRYITKARVFLDLAVDAHEGLVTDEIAELLRACEDLESIA